MTERDEKEVQFHLARRRDAVEPAPVYSNFVQVTPTPEDFTIHFGWYTFPPVPEAEGNGVTEVPVDPVARVVLPVNPMRNLIALLERQVSAYERNFGSIPDHPNKPTWLREAESAS